MLILLASLFIAAQPVAAQQPWYHHTTIYQIYPRSFYDTNGDGIGDIQGIIQKLDYIQSLGFQTIWCSPFFSSPQKDFGYDVADYRNIAPEYGTLQDAEQLIAETHQRGMRIVFDMVMNHTSIEHEWFKRDCARSPQERGPDKDFYVWRDKPNNWKSMVSGSAWHYHPQRGQYYYAAFLPFQPDLNYYNPEVKKEMLGHVRFWLQKGVDGFRLDIFNSLYEDSLFRNNPPNGNIQTHFQKPLYTANLQACLDFAEELRALCDSFGDKMLLGEIIGNRSVSRKYCGDSLNNRLTLAFDFEMLRFRFNARYFEKLSQQLNHDFSPPFMPVYVFSNHDRRRSLSRLKGNAEKAKLLHTLQLLTRGVPCMYYGEEIGMTDARFNYKTALDPIPQALKIPRGIMDMIGETLNRDELRTPMQWNDSMQAGFSTAVKTWLPVNQNYKQVNVQQQQRDSFSLYHTIRQLLALRSHFTGHATTIYRDGTLLYIASTHRETGKKWLTVINFSKHKKCKINSTHGLMNTVFSTNAAPYHKQGILAPLTAVVLHE